MSHNLPKTPINRLARRNSSHKEPDVLERTPQQMEQEQLVIFIMRIFDRFCVKNPCATDITNDVKQLSELERQVLPSFEQHSLTAMFTLDVLLNNYDYYCRKVKNRTQMDELFGRLLPTISQHSFASHYCEKVDALRTLIRNRVAVN